MLRDFTIKEGLEVQRKDLVEWERVLKTEVYAKLCEWVTKQNSEMDQHPMRVHFTGYNVTRGVDIDNAVRNIARFGFAVRNKL